MFGKRKTDRIPAIGRQYRGEVVHRVSDDFGLIEVVDDFSQRSLHFGTKEKQSGMYLKSHHTLALSYTRTMMFSLLFVDQPRSILNVGLGGGSIPKFLAHYYPDCHIDIVELREAVVDTAYDYFYLPRNSHMSVYIADIKQYLQQGKSTRYDMIIMDAFDQGGLSNSVKGHLFIEACKNKLNPGGLVVFNLWSEPEAVFKRMVYAVRKSFNKQSFVLPVADRSNQILVGANVEKLNMTPEFIEQRARQLESILNIGLPDMATTLIKRYRLKR